MQSLEGLPEKEKERRLKISKTMKKVTAKKRQAGLRAYWKRKKKEREAREKEEKKRKEKEKALQAKEREKEKKKKRGRRKKPGPPKDWYKRKKKKREQLKKKEKRKSEPKKPPFTYKIMICRNGRKLFTVGQYRTSKDAYEAFVKEKFKSESVVLPRMTRIDEDCTASNDECIMIQKTDSGPTVLRNEYGKLVEYRTNLDGWEIIDKFKYNVEETFWVWGYDNRSDRKDFTWIYDNLLIGDGFGPYEFKRVFTYRNKFLVRYDDGSLNFVMCKTEYDAVRLYNELQLKAKKEKVSQLVFIGDKSELTENTRKLEQELMDMTGWTLKKVRMKDSTYYSKGK